MPQKDVILVNIGKNLDTVFVRIPAGKFIMGSSKSGNTFYEEFSNEIEMPQREIFLREFWMGKYPVTNREFFEFVNQDKYQSKDIHNRDDAYWANGELNKPDHPVTGVTWNDAQAFCAWASNKSGMLIRLPTEAEWEKAARGTDGRIFPWGNKFDPSKKIANGGTWHSDSTSPVGSFSPYGDSPYECADMMGNVDEWTSTLFAKYPYDENDGRESAITPAKEYTPFSLSDFDYFKANKHNRVYRGGCFDSKGFDHLRCAHRAFEDAGHRFSFNGFRVCFSVKS